MCMGDNLMTQKNIKQNVISPSSVEVEYHAFYHAITKHTWLSILLRELSYASQE